MGASPLVMMGSVGISVSAILVFFFVFFFFVVLAVDIIINVVMAMGVTLGKYKRVVNGFAENQRANQL